MEGINPGEALGANSNMDSTTPNPDKLHFEEPIFHKYTDMEDLLLLDPIHDVDETGWPKPHQDDT